MAEPIVWRNEVRRLGQLVRWQHNPKRMTKKQAAGLRLSIEHFGIAVPFLISPDGDIYDGHQRQTVLSALKDYGPDTEVDVRVASRPLSDDERRELVVRLKQNQADWAFDLLTPLYQTSELLEWGFDAAELGIDEAAERLGVPKGSQPNPRHLPIDVIFTTDAVASAHAMLAYAAGWKIGTRSIQRNTGRPHTHLYSGKWEHNYSLTFIDNDYHNYQHSLHLETVAKFRPKYATVRDIMTEEQCEEAGIEFFPLPLILDWAAEIAEHAQNVIIIPKYDCFDLLPESYVLGYSVPTSHGGTPLPVSAFVGRRTHLLGGSWKAQLAHMAALGDSVVSMDNNYIQLQAKYGSYVLPDGSNGSLSEDLGLPGLSNPMYVALAISFGSVASKVNELFSGSAPVAEGEDETDERD